MFIPALLKGNVPSSIIFIDKSTLDNNNNGEKGQGQDCIIFKKFKSGFKNF